MYICICNAVTDRQIAEALSEGADTLAKLQKKLPVSTCCGSCILDVEKILCRVSTNTHSNSHKPWLFCGLLSSARQQSLKFSPLPQATPTIDS